MAKRDLSAALAAEEAAIAELEQQLAKRRAARAGLLAEAAPHVGFTAAVAGRPLLDATTLLQLLKWNTPTVYNGWEQITTNPEVGRECFNLEPLVDHAPQMGPLLGYAVTVRIRPGDKQVAHTLGSNRQRFREHGIAGATETLVLSPAFD